MTSDLIAAFQQIEKEIDRMHLVKEKIFEQSSFSLKLSSFLQDYHPQIRARIESELFDSGPLRDLIENQEITEIIVQGPENIFFEYRGQWETHNDHFLSHWTFKNFVHRLFESCKVETNFAHPATDGQWMNFRLHAIQPPLVSDYHHLSFRRQPVNPWSFNKLLDRNFLTPRQIDILSELIKSRKNFLVVGPTGSGKTSLLNAVLSEIPKSQRSVLIEDTRELQPTNPFDVRLLTRTDPLQRYQDFSIADLIRQSLRMRPDRLIVGEVRGGEAKDLLMAMSTGHEGSMGTLHAASAREALYRLEFLIQTGAPQWQIESIRRLIHLTLSHILVVGFDDNRRLLKQIVRITSLESCGFLLEEVG